MNEINNLGGHLVARAKVGLSRADKQKMKSEVIASVVDITPKGVSSSERILEFTEDLGIWIAIDTGGWYYWKTDVSKYVYGGMFVENPRLIDLGDNFHSMNTTEKNLARVCEAIASRDNGEVIGQGLYNYLYHAVINYGDKVIATYSMTNNVITFYVPFDSNDNTKYAFFKNYYGFYSNGIWNVQRYVGVSGGSGTTDYDALYNKPRINGVEIVGDVSTDELGIKIENAITYKGSVETYSNLTEIQEKAVGDMYNVNDTGRNYVWNGTEWDDMGEVFDISKIMTKMTIEIESGAGTNEQKILFYVLKNGLVGTYLVNDFYLVNCKLAYSNHYYAQMGTILGNSYYTYTNPIAPEDLTTPAELEIARYDVKTYTETNFVQKINVDVTSGTGTPDQKIIYYFLKNAKKGTFLVNEIYLVNCVEAYSNHYFVQMGTILGDSNYLYSNPTAPEDVTDGASLEVSRFSAKEYIDKIVGNVGSLLDELNGEVV